MILNISRPLNFFLIVLFLSSKKKEKSSKSSCIDTENYD